MEWDGVDVVLLVTLRVQSSRSIQMVSIKYGAVSGLGKMPPRCWANITYHGLQASPSCGTLQQMPTCWTPFADSQASHDATPNQTHLCPTEHDIRSYVVRESNTSRKRFRIPKTEKQDTVELSFAQTDMKQTDRHEHNPLSFPSRNYITSSSTNHRLSLAIGRCLWLASVGLSRPKENWCAVMRGRILASSKIGDAVLEHLR